MPRHLSTHTPSLAAQLGLAHHGDTTWMADGLCAQTDPDAFHPGKGGDTASTKRTCHRCPVTAQCLEYALTHDERFGIWGGKSAAERARIKKNCANV